MRVQASVQFSCAVTGRNLETELSTDQRNLVMFRQGKMSMLCSFCGGLHYWRLITKNRHGIADGTLPAATYGQTS